MKKLRPMNVSIQRNFYQTQFINKCARKKKLKSHIHRVEDYLFEILKNLCSLNRLTVYRKLWSAIHELYHTMFIKR